MAWFGTAVFALGVLSRAFGAHELDTSAPGYHDNPFALPGAAGDLLGALIVPSTAAYAPAVIGAMAGMVVRLRRSGGVERQQLKWFAYVASLMVGSLMLAALGLVAQHTTVGAAVGNVAWGSFLLLVVFGLPLALGASILRHRLYDIDVVINRTLVYGALTASLGATYLGARARGRADRGAVERGDRDLDAGGRRAVPAARARIQAAVDRRFYRRRYDATLTLEAFSARLRDELDLDALRGEIAVVVGETVQPAHVSVSLRSDT